ncbi:sucrose-6-phosphate hydrolase [Vibrio ponticus]|nr:sucrose-6-phosphate hydrolase [Vibrio ponticus]
MTCARELTLVNGQLKQLPVAEISQMRHSQQCFTGLSTCFAGLSAELQLHDLLGKELTIEVADDLRIEVDSTGLRTVRRNLKTNQWQSIEWQGRVESLQLLRDHSSLEVFINHGEAVSTSRFFGKGFGVESDKGFKVSSKQEISATCWQLAQ